MMIFMAVKGTIVWLIAQHCGVDVFPELCIAGGCGEKMLLLFFSPGPQIRNLAGKYPTIYFNASIW